MNIPEQIGPIRGHSGSLSTNLSECLRHWRDYYEQLYKADKKTTFELSRMQKLSSRSIVDTKRLNREIEWSEIVQSVNTLTDYSSPGADFI